MDFGWKKCLSSTPLKIRIYLSNVHKLGGVHLQYVNKYYAMFERLGMKTVKVTDYTNQAPSSILDGIMYKFNNPKK